MDGHLAETSLQPPFVGGFVILFEPSCDSRGAVAKNGNESASGCNSAIVELFNRFGVTP